MVHKWDIDKRTAVRSFEAGDTAVGAVCPGPDEQHPLYTAGAAVRCWDADGQVVDEYTGHAGGCGYLSSDTVESRVVTAALDQPDDNLLYAWPRRISAKSKRKSSGQQQPMAFAASGAITSVDVAGDGKGPGEAWAALAVCGGVVEIFVPPSRSSRKPQSSNGTVKFVRSAAVAGEKKGARIPVLASVFSRRQPATHVTTARGSFAAPLFEEVAYVTGGDVTGATVKRDDPAGPALGALAGQRDGKSASDGAAGGEHTVIAGGVRIADSEAAAAAVASAVEVSFGEQVLQLGLSAEPVGGGGARGNGAVGDITPTAGSLAHMLAQALHSNDQSLLEECLANTNEAIVRNTVSVVTDSWL